MDDDELVGLADFMGLTDLLVGQGPIESSKPTMKLRDDDLRTFHPLGEKGEHEERFSLLFAQKLFLSGPYSMAELSSWNPNLRPSGVYALFYQGGLPYYSNFRSPASTCPIYIGKTGQTGRATGRGQGGRGLHFRLSSEHAESLKQVGLPLMDFTYRFIVLSPEWVSLAEHFLIRLFQPIWNSALRGFGSRNYKPDTRGKKSRASPWDTVHQGRLGAGALERSRESTLDDFKVNRRGSERSYQRAKKLLKL